MLKSIDGEAIWDTTPGNGIWGMEVRDSSGEILSGSNDQLSMTPFLGGMGIEISVAGNGAIASGGKFTLTAQFIDNSKSSASITLQPVEVESRVSLLSARWGSKGPRDLTGKNENLRGDGNTDNRVYLELDGEGTLVSLEVYNIADGKSTAMWDTIPGNGRWAIAVVEGNKILNRSDGSIKLDLTGRTDLDLWMTDNGKIGDGRNRFETILHFSDGSHQRVKIENPQTVATTGQSKGLEITFMEKGNRDIVGRDERLSGNGKTDWRLGIVLESSGTVVEMKVTNVKGPDGGWDTIPGNGKWLIAVKQPGGSILNSPKGSVRLSVDGTASLELWVEDNGTLDDPDSAFSISLTFSNGQVLKKDFQGKRDEVTSVTEDGELILSKPWKAQSDYVGPYDQMKENGKGDWVFTLKIKGKGTVKSMSLREITGSGEWDTIPGNGRWALAVRGPGNRLLNNSNGSVSFPVPPNHNLHIFVEDNGSFKLERSRYEVTVNWDDGTSTKVDSQE